MMNNEAAGWQQSPERQQDMRRQQPSGKPYGLNPEYQEKLRKEAERTGVPLQKVCERYKVKQIADLTDEQYMRAMHAFSKMESLPPPADNGQMSLFTDLGNYAGELPFR